MKILFYNFVRKKNFLIYSLIITACIVFLTIVVTMFYSVFSKVLEKNNDIKNRELIISTYDNYETINYNLKNIKEIQEILYQTDNLDNDFKDYIIISKENYNIKKLIDDIKNNGYHASHVLPQREINVLKLIMKLLIFMVIFSVFIMFIIIKTIINSILLDDDKDISIMKSVGYSNMQIFYIYLFNTIFLTIFAFLIALLITKIIIHFIFPLIEPINNIGILELSFINKLFELIIIIIIVLISNISLKRKI